MTTGACGVLYVVSTPIGNLDDLSPRARQILTRVDVVAAEDTRRTRGLLSSIGANRALIAYHDHNESRQTPRLLERLKRGESVALVSDAGTPAISDPGLKLVQAALGERLRVVGVPGPNAAIAALSISGLPTDRFVFEGFLPSRAAARRAHLDGLKEERRTLIFFEAVHRIEATLADLAAVFGAERRAAIARELTKRHEALYSGTLQDLGRKLGDGIPLKGEFVLIVAGASMPVTGETAEARRVFAALAAELPTGQAARLTAAITGVARNAVYRLTHKEE